MGQTFYQNVKIRDLDGEQNLVKTHKETVKGEEVQSQPLS